MERRGLVRYVGKRLLVTVPQILLITVLVWFVIRALPADPVARVAGKVATPEAYAQAEHSLGLDRPLLTQFGDFFTGLVQLDFGTSWVSQSSIGTEIAARFPITLQLIVMSFALALLIGLPLGMLTAIRPGGSLDRGVFVYSLFAGAQPEFWWGLMFSTVFAYELGVLPPPDGLPSVETLGVQGVTGFSLIDTLLAGDPAAFWTVLRYYLLPSLTLAFVLTGPIVKMVRQNVIRVLASEFLLYARAAGLDRRHILLYAGRNALSPVATLVGVLFGFMLGGAVLIENVFSLNGLGQYAVERTLNLDYPAIQGVVLAMTAFCLIVYLAVDVVQALIDPRIRYR